MKKILRRKSGRGSVKFTLASSDRLAFYGAAYGMTRFAYAALERGKTGDAVILWPKKGVRISSISAAFEKEYLNQIHRWAIARSNRGLARQELGKMLELSERLADNSRMIFPDLPAEKKGAITELLKEAESGPWDPLGIAAPWAGKAKV